MRTNIFLDDNLVKKAIRISGANTKEELINITLREFIQNHSRLDIRDLRGKISFRDDYNYKNLRTRK
jgi:Arc/MetJ family transcription regulator